MQALAPYREQIRAWLTDDALRLTKIYRRLRALQSVSDIKISEVPAPPGRYRDAATGGCCRFVPTAPLRTD